MRANKMPNIEEWFPLPEKWFDDPDDLVEEQIRPIIGDDVKYISKNALNTHLGAKEVVGDGVYAGLKEGVRVDHRKFLQMLDACDIRNLRLPINDDVDIHEYNRTFYVNNENVYDALATGYYELEWSDGSTVWVDMSYDTGTGEARFFLFGDQFAPGDSRVHDVRLDTARHGSHVVLLDKIFPGWRERLFEPFVKGWEKQIADWRAEDEAEEEKEEV
jgi:hypothetical protein